MGRIITGERSTIEAFCIEILTGSSGLHDGDGDRREGSGTRVYFSCRGREE